MALDYGLGEVYEGVAVVMCGREGYWGRLGKFVRPEGLSDAAAHLWRVYESFGGHAKPVSVRERLRQQEADGDLAPDRRALLTDWFEAALEAVEDADLSVDEVVAVVAPRLREAEQHTLIEDAVDAFSNGGSLGELPAQLAKVERIGTAGADVDEGSVGNLTAALTKRKRTRRIDLGIDEVDTLLGGVPQGTQTVFVGGTGEGKSMALSQVAAHTATQSLNVAVASLEIGTDIWNARFGAALTGISVDMLLDNSPQVRATFGTHMTTLLPTMGLTSTRYFSPRATPVSEVIAWCDELERRWKAPVDVLVVDYADKLLPEGKGNQDSTYAGMGEVYERLRIWANEGRRWIFTASQAKGRSKKDAKHKRDVEDAADSMNKARVADLVFTLNKSEGPSGERLIEIYCAKNRYGEAAWSSGPLSTAFERGRLCP